MRLGGATGATGGCDWCSRVVRLLGEEYDIGASTHTYVYKTLTVDSIHIHKQIVSYTHMDQTNVTSHGSKTTRSTKVK